MPNVALVPALAKTLLAIAWANGTLHPEEEATVKEVVGLLPELSAQQWATIELYLIAPISAQERAMLLQDTLAHIRSAEDKRVALQAVDAMLTADGSVDAAEEPIGQEIRAAIAATDVSLLGRFGRAVGGAVRPTLPRERDAALWRSNPIVYLLRLQSPSMPLHDPQIELAALAAAIMLQVARVSSARVEAERPIMIACLTDHWQVTPDQAAQIVHAALMLSHRSIDYQRIAVELARRASEQQRVALLDTLFAIANAAEQVSPAEIDEIRVIAERLNLTRQQFIAAKLKIPSEDRGGL